jgi:AraC-like DNA-binding protein
MSATPSLPMHEWSCLRNELIWVYDAPVDAAVRDVSPVALAGNRAWYLRKGIATVKASGCRYRARPGEWLILPREVVSQHFSRDACILSVSFRCEWPSGESLLDGRGGMLAGEEYPSLERTASRLERLVRRHYPDVGTGLQVQTVEATHYLEMQALFHQWLAQLIVASSAAGIGQSRLRTRDDRLWKALRRLHECPLDEEFPSARLRAESGLSQVHLDRLFVREFGSTTGKYWERRRLEFARQCLQTSSLPVKEISWRLGFTSDSYFIAWFRRLTGESPGRFRSVRSR